MTTPGRRLFITLAFLSPFAVILIGHALHYLPFISDDALISLRYADRLLEGKGLTWTDGRPVEGYSNLLWILLVALLGLFGVDLVDATRVLGILGMTVILYSIARWSAGRSGVRAAWFPAAVALLFLSLGAPVAVWAIGGMEQPLWGALIAISVPLMFAIVESGGPERARTLALSLTLGLLCLTRPDGPIFAAAAAVTLLVVGRPPGTRRSASQALLVLLFPALLYGGQLVFRLLYYGELVPNTAHVKLAPSLARLDGGTQYLADGLKALAPFSYLALLSLCWLLVRPRSRARAVYPLAMGVMWGAYVAIVGGDIFPAYRHFVPLMVVFAFALAEGGQVVVSRLASRPRLLYPLIALALLLSVPYAQRQLADKQSQRAIRERWEWQGKEVGLLLKTAFWKEQPLLAVTAAGCVPYWSELPALDMMGLNDDYLPRHPPPDFGQGFIGHELGDGRYVMSRRPDIIVFSAGTEPAYRSGHELAAMEEFHERYVPVAVRTSPGSYAAIVYFDRYSEKIGIARSGSTVTVPGFLLTGKDTVAHLNKEGKLVARLAAGQLAQVRFRADFPARWVVDVRASTRDGIESEITQDAASVSVTLRAAGAGPVEVEEIVLKRAPAGENGRAAGHR